MNAHLGRWLVAVALALTLAPFTHAQSSAPRGSVARGETYTQGLLWKIESPAGRASHVFGTIHLGDARVAALPAAVRESFGGASSFAMEVKFDAANALQLANRMVSSDGRDLPAVLGPALYQKLAQVAPSLGLPPELLRALKPWAMALLLMMPQPEGDAVLDDRLYRMAVEQKKGVHQLETVDEQLDTFDGLSESDQVELVRQALANRERLPELVNRMVDAYVARDLGALYRLADDGQTQDAEMRRLDRALMTRLLDDRNVRMADRADALLRAGGAFVAVGALHLYGEHGLLALLAQRGYRVTRVY